MALPNSSLSAMPFRQCGGKSLKIEAVEFDKGHKEYAGYQAWQPLRFSVGDNQGQTLKIQTGSIIERDDQFEFLSFERD